jgi:hypothetical protein
MIMLLAAIITTTLAFGFVLGRLWEMRQAMQRQTASDSITPSDRHAALADRLARPR